MPQVSGLVFERTADGGIGQRIPGVRISFRPEVGGSPRHVESSESGRYRIELPAGRYVAEAEHEGFELFSTTPGFVVVTSDRDRHTFNVFLMAQAAKKLRQPELPDPPVRGATLVAAQVLSASGEYSPRVIDIDTVGLGPGFQLVRKYRSSLRNWGGWFGLGWTATYEQQLARTDNGIIYLDGLGCSHFFRKNEDTADVFISPDGFYSILREDLDNGSFSLAQRRGNSLHFEPLHDGGRLIGISDRYGNWLSLQHKADALIAVDAWGRTFSLSFVNQRVTKAEDHTGRQWRYEYDQGRLVEIRRPATNAFPDGTSVRYAYDNDGRLSEVVDALGQTVLSTLYDSAGRVIKQKQGAGFYELEYSNATQPSLNGTTSLKLKNGTRLDMEHDDRGHIARRLFYVSERSLSNEDKERARTRAKTESNDEEVPLITEQIFNKHGEVISRVLPTGEEVYWTYSEDDPDPRCRGNLLELDRRPAPDHSSDQKRRIVAYGYDDRFQRRTSLTNALCQTTRFHHDRVGNLIRKTYPNVRVQKIGEDGRPGVGEFQRAEEKFEWNHFGQMTAVVNASGTRTVYAYYPIEDPTGQETGSREAASSDFDGGGGLLARTTHDVAYSGRTAPGEPIETIVHYGYDEHGRSVETTDPKGNSIRSVYDGDQLVKVRSRPPKEHTLHITHDANGRPIEYEMELERFAAEDEEDVLPETITVKERYERNVLGNVVARTVESSDDQALTERFERDKAENIIRKVRPSGTTTYYEFDERGLLLRRVLGSGTPEEASFSYGYTLDGRRRLATDPRGHTTHYAWSGFGEYIGFENAVGTCKRQKRDAVGNVTRITITGALRGNSEEEPHVLREIAYSYDELNRLVRMDQAWRDADTGDSLGNSTWDEAEGVVSTILEYGLHGRPVAARYEDGRVVRLTHDALLRVVRVENGDGEAIASSLDANGNAKRLEYFGPEVEADEERIHHIVDQEFNENDQLVARSTNLEPPERYAYDAFGGLLAYRNPHEQEFRYLRDTHGRMVGRATLVAVPEIDPAEITVGGVPEPTKPPTWNGSPFDEQGNIYDARLLQRVTQRAELDKDSRTVARFDALGRAIRFELDAHGRRTAVRYPDGAEKRIGYDEAGNVARVEDAKGNVVEQEHDAANRLVHRIVQATDGPEHEEKFVSNGLNQLVRAEMPGVELRRTYDSLTRMLRETRVVETEASGTLEHMVAFNFDAAGNLTDIKYPGGRRIRRRYDKQRRIEEVEDVEAGELTHYEYASAGRLRRQTLGNALEASFSYKACVSNCLTEVVYRSKHDEHVVEGRRYTFNTAGQRTSEAFLGRGNGEISVGDRYLYDSGGRLSAALHNVEDLENPGSAAERATLIERDAAGIIRRRVRVSEGGAVTSDEQTETNERSAYLKFGNRAYEYDANGNRLVEKRSARGNDEDGGCSERQYEYDHANRPVQMRCVGADGEVLYTIEYVYDPFGRLVLRRRTDGEGNVKETVNTWNGRQRIETYENGQLKRSFAFGARVNEPVAMRDHDEEKDFYYTFDAAGRASALADVSGRVVERYKHDLLGEIRVAEHMGEEFDESAGPKGSLLGNDFFNGDRLHDADAGLSLGIGPAYDPFTGQPTNPDSSSGDPNCGYSSGGPDSSILGNQDGTMETSGELVGAGGALIATGGSLAKAGAGAAVGGGPAGVITGGVAVIVGGVMVAAGVFSAYRGVTGNGDNSSGSGDPGTGSGDDPDGAEGGSTGGGGTCGPGGTSEAGAMATDDEGGSDGGDGTGGGTDGGDSGGGDGGGTDGGGGDGGDGSGGSGAGGGDSGGDGSDGEGGEKGGDGSDGGDGGSDGDDGDDGENGGGGGCGSSAATASPSNASTTGDGPTAQPGSSTPGINPRAIVGNQTQPGAFGRRTGSGGDLGFDSDSDSDPGQGTDSSCGGGAPSPGGGGGKGIGLGAGGGIGGVGPGGGGLSMGGCGGGRSGLGGASLPSGENPTGCGARFGDGYGKGVTGVNPALLNALTGSGYGTTQPPPDDGPGLMRGGGAPLEIRGLGYGLTQPIPEHGGNGAGGGHPAFNPKALGHGYTTPARENQGPTCGSGDGSGSSGSGLGSPDCTRF